MAEINLREAIQENMKRSREQLAECKANVVCCRNNIDQLKKNQATYREFLGELEQQITRMENRGVR